MKQGEEVVRPLQTIAIYQLIRKQHRLCLLENNFAATNVIAIKEQFAFKKNRSVNEIADDEEEAGSVEAEQRLLSLLLTRFYQSRCLLSENFLV